MGIAGCDSSTKKIKGEDEELHKDRGELFSDSINRETDISEKQAKPDYQWAEKWEAGRVVSHEEVEAYGIDECFKILDISDSIFKRIDGNSFKSGCPVKRKDLRYLKLLHYDLQGKIRLGELICNAKIADDLCGIFKTFYDSVYPIASMQLIDEYGADDEVSMQANNTSCFNFRHTSAGNKISRHGYGMAVDLNPLYNPYFNPKKGQILPRKEKFICRVT